jgi:atypical dual specificity phosphatase
MLSSFYWVIQNEIAGMALPTAARAYHYLEDTDQAVKDELNHEIKQLQQLGIGAVITLTETPLAAPVFEKADINYLHIPIPDMTAPTLSQINQFIDFAKNNIKNERAVVTHCLGGSGRTGTMIACYLVSKEIPAKKAIEMVRSVRPSAIETMTQEGAIIEFEMHLRSRKE